MTEELAERGEFVAADLGSMADVRRLAALVKDRSSSLDLLVNNAAVTLRRKALTVDGIERTFAINTVAPFLLTTELTGLLSAAGGRVVNIVTELFSRFRLEVADLRDPARYSMFSAYSRSKLALMMVTLEQAHRYLDEGVTVAAVHPGVIPTTRLSSEMPQWLIPLGPLFARLMGRRITTAAEAAGLIRRAAAGTVEPGTLYSDGNRTKYPAQADDRSVRLALWQELERITVRV